VDREGRILLLNSTARKILRVNSDVVGHPVEEVLPNTRLPEVLRSGKGEFDQEQIIHSAHILTNRVPLVVNGEVVGALASFRDMTEIQAMAEELTGVRRYLEALRIQKHEFLNQLQALSGLLHLQEYQRAASFISAVVEDRSNLVSLVIRRIRVPEVGGLILAKMGRCRELDIRMELDENSFLGEDSGITPRHLVVVLGNILENALEAVASLETSRRVVELGVYHESGRILLSVHDRGPGIPQELREKILEKGITTKEASRGGEAGFGLFNVLQVVELYGGELHLESSQEGTECIVDLPEGGAHEPDSRTRS
jgi:sensor histidine kinase regulating citrate/malate metabolism